jgi:hypothetical protein
MFTVILKSKKMRDFFKALMKPRGKYRLSKMVFWTLMASQNKKKKV